jgi:hypothetical protein
MKRNIADKVVTSGGICFRGSLRCAGAQNLQARHRESAGLRVKFGPVHQLPQRERQQGRGSNNIDKLSIISIAKPLCVNFV